MVSEVGWINFNTLSHSLQGNLAENWRRWKQRFQLYMVASGKDTKSDDVKSAIFLHVAGQDALEVFNTFTWDSDGDDKKLEKVIEKFEIYCMPRKNVTWERHIFNTRDQQPGETIDQYATDLRKKAKYGSREGQFPRWSSAVRLPQ